MTSKRTYRPQPIRGQHPVHVVHRVSAAVLGLTLWVFAGLGFAQGLDFLSTSGVSVIGLSTNGLLATISVVAGTLLVASAAWGGPVASTVNTIFGGVFLLSGLVHLAILNTPYNIFAFQLSNVFFSLIAGMVLLFFGLYGRLSGGLPPDNPYRLAHPRRTDRPDPREQLADRNNEPDAHEQEITEAELAVGEGHPTAEQMDLVRRDQARHQAYERSRAYEHARELNNDRRPRSES